jgi:type I restriction enzyme S subunit
VGSNIRLGDLITLQRGHDLPYSRRHQGSIPVVSSSGVTDFHNEAKADGPGVVTGRYGTIGEVFYVEGQYWPLNTTLFVSDFKGNDALFVSYLLRTIDFRSHSGKSGVPGVNRNDLHELIVRRPALPEQRAIATALSDADALIASLNALIIKKRDVKQAAMQQLMTGKTRLSGFESEWQDLPLSAICSKVQDGTHFSPKLGGERLSLHHISKYWIWSTGLESDRAHQCY